MFKVTFIATSDSMESAVVFQSKGLELCVEFALALHRSSNVPHTITVSQDGTSCLILSTPEKPMKE